MSPRLLECVPLEIDYEYVPINIQVHTKEPIGGRFEETIGQGTIGAIKLKWTPTHT